MLLQDELGDELADTLHIEQLDDVDLTQQLVRGRLMPMQAFHLHVEPVRPLDATATTLMQEGHPQVLRVIVEVLSALAHSPVHRVLGLGLSLRCGV